MNEGMHGLFHDQFYGAIPTNQYYMLNDSSCLTAEAVIRCDRLSDHDIETERTWLQTRFASG